MMQIKADDFKLIQGINRGIEKHLHDADIRTYAQLAALKSQEILSKLGKGKGYSIRRIEEENWIGQAEKLIPKNLQRKSRKKQTTKSTVVRQHYENFTIELLLDERNQTRRTHIVHVQSGDADTWAGWGADQLFDFVVRHAGVHTSYKQLAIATHPNVNMASPTSSLSEQSSQVHPEPISAIPVEMSHKQDSSSASFADSQLEIQTLAQGEDLSLLPIPQQLSPTQEITSSISLLGWKITLPNKEQSLHSIPHDQAFDVSLMLELNNVSLPDASELDCTAALYAKKLGGKSRKLIGETQQLVAFNHIISLTVPGATVSIGIYRLEAQVTVKLAGMEGKHPHKLMSFLESGLFQAY